MGTRIAHARRRSAYFSEEEVDTRAWFRRAVASLTRSCATTRLLLSPQSLAVCLAARPESSAARV